MFRASHFLTAWHDRRLVILAAVACLLTSVTTICLLHHRIDLYAMSFGSLALVLASAALAILGLSLAGAIADRRLRERDRRLATAVNNMTQGLVMFDSAERLVVCNDRYIEMYGLSRGVVKPGCMLSQIIDHRIATGRLDRGAAEYRQQLLDAMAQNEAISWVVETEDGRAISVVNKPIGGGDWVSVHENITERRNSEKKLERTQEFLPSSSFYGESTATRSRGISSAGRRRSRHSATSLAARSRTTPSLQWSARFRSSLNRTGPASFERDRFRRPVARRGSEQAFWRSCSDRGSARSHTAQRPQAPGPQPLSRGPRRAAFAAAAERAR